MTQTPEQYDLFAAIFPLTRKIEQLFTRFARARGISSGSQAGVFCYLMDQTSRGDVYQKDVEQMFQISAPSATNLLHALEQQGLIRREKNDADNRRKKIILTEESLEVREQVRDLKAQCYSVLLRDIPLRDLAVFFRVCARISQNAVSSGDK